MRTHFNNRQLAHVWAAQSQKEGRGSNFYFEGATLYSYGAHFPVAAFVAPGIVLFTAHSYSNSTSKHKNYAHSALHGLPVRVFTVDRVPSHYSASAGNIEHSLNVADYRRRIASALEHAARAKSNAEWRVNSARELIAELNAYLDAFELASGPGAYERPEPVSPELIAQAGERAREASKRKAAESKERNARRAAEEAERARIYALTLEEKTAEWRAGKLAYYSFPWDAPTMLRLRGDVIETSRGAEVPASVAPILWRMVNYTRSRGVADNVAERCAHAPMRIGAFELREIGADGSLVIGCHTLAFSELQRMAQTLQLA